MFREKSLTSEDFDRLLAWLDSDRERAAQKYVHIRQSLTKILAWRGCSEAEDLTDETIDRVVKKVHLLAETYKGDPTLYFYGVAKRVRLEYLKSLETRRAATAPPPAERDEDVEPLHRCLDQCVQTLAAADQELVLTYYEKEGQAKIDFRKELAWRMGLEATALRVRMHRIRSALQKCIKKCLEQGGAGETD